MEFVDRLQHAWNAFMNKDPTPKYGEMGNSYYYRPDRPRLHRGNEKTISAAVYNRIALDVAAINIKHVKLDENDRYIHDIKSGLNNCLTLEANVDQTARSFFHDVVISMFDEGIVALVPIETTLNPKVTKSFDILSMRTGKVIEWFPQHVKVRVYNEKTGNKEDVILPKSTVAIIENPLFSIINEPNSTMQRLVRKLALLDAIDEQSASGKLDLIIQLPYVIKSDARRKQAEERRKDIEVQLSGSKYGIAYTDGTERITQLNRPIENNLMKTIEYLTSMLYSQLGITQTILDGTADEKTMLNYYNRTIEPIVSAIVDEMKRKFLSKTARSQKQSIVYFRDPFKLVPINDIAEIADKFTRNEIMSKNEFRQVIGMKPSDDPKADQLINSNISQSAEALAANGQPMQGQEGTQQVEEPMTEDEYQSSMDELDDLDDLIDELEDDLNEDDEEDDDDEDEDEEKKKELKHYASPYYDPVKAHEYYMRTRELKGRKSTSSLNDEGKSAAKYIKEQLTTERKSKVQSHKDDTDRNIESLKTQRDAKIKAHKNLITKTVETLREKLKNMDKEEKERRKDEIQGKIDTLRESNKTKRAELQEEFSSSRTSLRTTHKETKTRLKEEYDEKYLQELDKLKAAPEFQKKKSKK